MFFFYQVKNTVNYRSFSRGVDTGWVGGRGRSAYNLRLPPKASGKDTGLGQQFRSKPVLPVWMQCDCSNMAYELPVYYCAFEGCDFETLEEHICKQDGSQLKGVARSFSNAVPPSVRTMEAYQAGLSWACQQIAPVAHVALDRKALKQYRDAQTGDKVRAAICCRCAQHFAYTNSMGEGDQIQWKKSLAQEQQKSFPCLWRRLEKAIRNLLEHICASAQALAVPNVSFCGT